MESFVKEQNITDWPEITALVEIVANGLEATICKDVKTPFEYSGGLTTP